MEKSRVHILAKELGVTSKSVLEKCRAEGLEDIVKNHMSVISPGLAATIREWFSESSGGTAIEIAQSVDLEAVKVKAAVAEEEPEITEVLEQELELIEAPEETTRHDLGAEGEVIAEAPASSVASTIVEMHPYARPPATTPERAAKEAIPPPAPKRRAPGIFEREGEAAPPQPPVGDGEESRSVPGPKGGVEAPSPGPDRAAAELLETAAEPAEPSKPLPPAGPVNIPKPAKITGPRVVRYEAPDRDVRPPRPSADRPATPRARSYEAGAAPADESEAARAARKRKEAAAKTTKGGQRRHHDDERLFSEKIREYRDQDLAERQARLKGATGRKIHRRSADEARSPAGSPAGPKTRAKILEPITVKEFCANIGLNQLQVAKALMKDHQMMANLNTVIPNEIAMLLALDHGIELEVVAARTRLEALKEEFDQRERKNLVLRPPVVTMMGHVDHGKTSLLDAIRKAAVASTEDGGITQHIGSYHYNRNNLSVTFLDTPGHAAFTAMRERGANLTDIVVLVVAVDDGVMPQTVEAINHAKAAGVQIVVALNKIDLGRDKEMQIYGQLAEHELAPVVWGGTVEAVGTSTVTGEGIDHLLEILSTMNELLELKADPTIPGHGAVIEAETKPGAGNVIRGLVQEGTLHVGDILVCGPGFGKVRALLDDRGRRIESAGPSIPVEIWGLSDVPASGDRFYQVDSLSLAGEIANETRQLRASNARRSLSRAMSLADIFSQKSAHEIPELNIVIKADVQGSVDALLGLLADLPTDKVRLEVRHSGVGAVTESDVLLAAASGGVVVAYRVDTIPSARRLADDKGVEIRNNRVVYEVAEDISSAMEGLLAPEEHLELRGALEVRNLFRVTRVGLVAGCYAVSGPIQRSHWIKVIRNGVVVRERCPIRSLRHFKDDVREVRSGQECGILLEGFEDVKVGDRLEAYELVQVAQTLT